MPHIVVRHLEASNEVFISAAGCDIVSGSAYILFPATADYLCWRFFHNDEAMKHFLLYKTSFYHIHTQAPAPDASGIHTATILRVDAKRTNLQLDSDNFTIGVGLTIFDALGHGSCHQACADLL